MLSMLLIYKQLLFRREMRQQRRYIYSHHVGCDLEFWLKNYYCTGTYTKRDSRYLKPFVKEYL